VQSGIDDLLGYASEPQSRRTEHSKTGRPYIRALSSFPRVQSCATDDSNACGGTDEERQLEAELAPWAERAQTGISIKPVEELPATSPWKLLRLDTGRPSAQAPDDWPKILRTADELGTTEVILPDNGGLWLARLNQARYWSQSQARLLARRIVWEHVDVLFCRSKAA